MYLDTSADNPSHEQWERLETESEPAWAAFSAYRDMSPQRSTRVIAARLGKSTAIIQRWSSKHSWIRRVAAFDRRVDDRRRREHEDALVDDVARAFSSRRPRPR